VRGLMQDVPLTMELVRRRLGRHSGPRAVVTGTEGEPRRSTWAETGERSARLRGALAQMRIGAGDRVATFARNHHPHLELMLAVPAADAVLNPVNTRLTPDQVAWILNHSMARVLFADAGLIGLLDPVRDQLEYVERVVVIDDEYEQLLADAEPDHSPVAAGEDDALALCYTSGTAGDPKGVLFSHRSTILHALSLTMADSHAVSRAHTVMPITAVCHVLAWSLPYAAALTGADLVLQGPSNEPRHLAKLIESERVTTGAAVPTVWLDMEALFDGDEFDLSSMRELLIGGMPVPKPLIRRYRERGITIAQGWGMTEMSPSGTMSRETGEGEGASNQGTAMALVELRLVGDDGAELDWDGATVGELEVRGPCVIAEYYEPTQDASDRFRDGWLRTGDLARIDPDGTVEIVDRAKDLVKSGGEWISSVELESAIAAHPAVQEAAVVAVPDEKWGERPLALVVAGTALEQAELAGFLEERVARWWIPERLELVDEIPKTSVGKYDKRRIRELYA